jgi:hypothetical protein
VTCQGAVQVESRGRSRPQSVFRAHTAPNQALVAPREARDLGMGRSPMQWVVVTQWVRTGDGASPT